MDDSNRRNAGKQFKSLLEAVRKQEQAMDELLKATRDIENALKDTTLVRHFAAFPNLQTVLKQLSTFHRRTGSTKPEELSSTASRVLDRITLNKSECANTVPSKAERASANGVSIPGLGSDKTATVSPKQQQANVNKSAETTTQPSKPTLKPASNGVSLSTTSQQSKPKLTLQDQLFNMAGFGQLVQMLEGYTTVAVRTDEIEQKIMKILRRLKGIPVNTRLLEKTKAGITLSKLKKDENRKVAALSKFLVKLWKATVKTESAREAKRKSKADAARAPNAIHTPKSKVIVSGKSERGSSEKPVKEKQSYMAKLLEEEKRKMNPKPSTSSSTGVRQSVKRKEHRGEPVRKVENVKRRKESKSKNTRDSSSEKRYVDPSSTRDKSALLRAGYGYATDDDGSSGDEDEFDENDPWYKEYQRKCRASFERIQAEERLSAKIGQKEDEEAFIDDD